jgi:MoaA/NifB/PqqE/SkfB family radical SAM enzyme
MKRFNLVAVCSTTRCNGKCFSCARELLSPEQKNIDLDLDILKPLLPNTDFLSFNGIFGDVIYHPKIFSFTEYCKNYEYLQLEFATNGCFRDNSFWTELGKQKIKIIFGIDGLEDTHYRYRKTDFNKVINNMKLFIDGGGYAVWQYITFKYNYHQIEKASQLAKKLGCSEFMAIRANQYDDNKWKRPKEDVISRNEIFKLSDKSGKYCYWRFRNGKFFNSIFVDVMGYVHPCCHMGVYTIGLPYFTNPEKYPRYDELKPIFMENKDKLSLYNNDISDIIENSYLKYIYNNKDKLSICNYRCYGKLTNINDKFKDEKPSLLSKQVMK